ncbi:MAG: HAD family hydrolase [Treponema sp.]|jgi:phosphoglycolate phosphatase|nr:HAD family hydrolase [Treponema sp.]
MKYTYLFFDLDGTLTDSAQGIINSLFYALARSGVRTTDTESLKQFIGPPLMDTFQIHYGFDRKKAETAVRYYREYYEDKGLYENSVYEGIPELLAELNKRGFKLVTATSKPEEYAVKILSHFKVADYFCFIAGSCIDETRSKKSEVINYALSACGIQDKKSVLMIGDRKHDIIGAAECGIDALGVLYGFGSRDELTAAGAVSLCETVTDMRKKLLTT